MSDNNNPLAQIKSKEQKGLEEVQDSKKEMENQLEALDQEYRKKFENAENDIGTKIDAIVDKVKRDIADMKKQEKRNLDRALDKIESVDKKKIEQAAQKIVGKIMQ